MAGTENSLARLRHGCLGGQVLSPLDNVQEGQQRQEMPVAMGQGPGHRGVHRRDVQS